MENVRYLTSDLSVPGRIARYEACKKILRRLHTAATPVTLACAIYAPRDDERRPKWDWEG